MSETSVSAPIETPVEKPAQETATPKDIIHRNKYGLIENNLIRYQYTPEGLINWRAMINPVHLAINKGNFERRNKPVPDSMTGLDDRDLLILLPGIKELAQIRGFNSVVYNIVSPHPNYVVASCTISWVPNFETEFRVVTFSAIGDASPDNTNKFGKFYLGPIAENRAFVRAVRNFLKINIVSQEEINTSNPLASDSQTQDPALESMIQVMDAHGVTFEKIKETLVKEQFPNAEKLKELSEIPPAKRFELIGRIKKRAEEKKPKKT